VQTTTVIYVHYLSKINNAVIKIRKTKKNTVKISVNPSSLSLLHCYIWTLLTNRQQRRHKNPKNTKTIKLQINPSSPSRQNKIFSNKHVVIYLELNLTKITTPPELSHHSNEPNYIPQEISAEPPSQKHRLIGGGPITTQNSPDSESANLLQNNHTNQSYACTANGILLVACPTQQHINWKPRVTPSHQVWNSHPFQRIVQSLNLETIKAATQRKETDTIVKLSSKPDVFITVKDMRDLISYGIPIYHELLVLSLEALCSTYHAAYLDPSFYPTLLSQGYLAVLRCFASTRPSTTTRPSLNHPNIVIPLHINGNHWVALGRRIIDETVHLFYADDLNQRNVEENIRQQLQSIPGFIPPSAKWVSCLNYTYTPHSNECGPRTILALAVIMSHPYPTQDILLPYMNPNLAMQARAWMSHLLLQGTSPLLPHQGASPPPIVDRSTRSLPNNLIAWTQISIYPNSGQQEKARHHTSYNKNSGTQPKPQQTNISMHTGQIQESSVPAQPSPNHNTSSNPLRKPKKLVTPPNQLTMHDFQTSMGISTTQSQQQRNDQCWGHSVIQIDSNSVFRVLLQNPRGLKLGDPLNTQYSLSLCQSIGAGAICLPETNTNWAHRSAHSVLHSLLCKSWRHSTYSASFTSESFETLHQPGGTLQIITSDWTSRILEKGTDPFGLGRWSYAIMRGAGNKRIAMITAYRVCTQSINTIGETTATAQQFRQLSKQMREHDTVDDPKPRWQFIIDLQAWIESLVSEGHDIILCLDANENINNNTGSYTPLQYISNKPTIGSGHDGSLATLMCTCGLVDPLLLQHPDQTPPSTYSRSDNRIDYIVISSSLVPAVLRTGIMPYDSVFISDHRPTYVDFESSLLFQDDTNTIGASTRRGLQLQDPRLVEKYYESLRRQLEYHKLPDKILQLYQDAQESPVDHTIAIRYEKIDKLLTESMLVAERKCSKKYSEVYQWSPALTEVVNVVRFWRIRLKQAKGVMISQHAINKAAEKANIPDGLTHMTTVAITKKLREAHQQLKEFQKKHIELRETYLEALAAARVDHKGLSGSSNPESRKKATEKEIKRILRNERCRRSHRTVRRYLRPRENGGLTKIDIPADSNADPKTWNGPWLTITQPEDIAMKVCSANAAQYHQACDTPFATEPLLSSIGLDGAGPGSDSIMNGILPPEEVTRQLLPETVAILTNLANLPASSTIPSLATSITPEKFQALYKTITEQTSSSPSGRHVGHYKAIAKSDDLSKLWAAMMHIPHLSGFSPSRWRNVVDVMLEKSPGNSKLHRLRIIALQESDFNQSNRLAIGRPVMHYLEDNKLLPSMQHGSRPAKLCISAVLNKQLQMEIKRYQKKPMAYIENDATGCYDRIVNPLVLLFLRKLGIPQPVLQSIAKTWANTTHKIKTTYGVSNAQYQNSLEYFLFGPGQGSTIGPLLWLICFLLIVRSLGMPASGMTMWSVDGSVMAAMKGDAFVDDAGLGCAVHLPAAADEAMVRRSTNIAVQDLQDLAQRWERLLFSTGGALNLQKCFWFLLSWRWTGRSWTLDTTNTLQAQIQLTSGLNLNNPTPIKRIDPTDSYRTLGVHISPSGSNKGAIVVMTDIVLSYAKAVTGSHLNRADTLTSYVQHLLPRLRFQLPALSLSEAECNKLQSPVLKAALPKMHINRNTARSIVHGPVCLGGMALPHLYTVQGIDKLHLFLGHLRLEDDTGKLIKISMSYVQLLSGATTFFLNKPYTNYSWVEWGWVTSLWNFLGSTNLSFQMPSHWTPSLPRLHDVCLMDYFVSLRLPHSALKSLNYCRLYLQVITLSDISSADGTYILPEAKMGLPLPYRTSVLHWPTQGRPHSEAWVVWRHSLSYLEEREKLIQKLGEWKEPSHQKWQAYFNPEDQNAYITEDGQGYRKLHRVTRQFSYNTRSTVRPIFDISVTQVAHPLVHQLVPATIQIDINSHPYVNIDYSLNAIPQPAPETAPIQPTFYRHIKRLLGTGKHLEKIKEAIESKSLVVSTDGSYDPINHRASYSWVFSYDATQIYSGSSQLTSGNKNAYRAELLGILAAIQIIHEVEELYPTVEGEALLISDCAKALRRALKQGPIGVKDATQDEFDLILELRQRRITLRTKITAEWTPGHPSVTDPRGEQVKNATAHSLAVKRLQQPMSTGYEDDILTTPIISVLHREAPITKGLPQQIMADVHYGALQHKLLKDNEWTEEVFQRIDWDSYHRAIISLPRPHRLSISKLSHNLWNTNCQNSKFYGHESSCPYCSMPETQQHVFYCPSATATENRTQALQTLQQSLSKASTPTVLLQQISTMLISPSAPALSAALQNLVQDQLSIGWQGLPRGHLSKHWKAFYQASLPANSKRKDDRTNTWSKKVILALWKYSQSLWESRNAVVHGQTLIQRESKSLKLLRDRAKSHYIAYTKDPHIVPSSRTYLFDRPLPNLQQLSRQQLQSWINSVEEAIQTQAHRGELRAKSQRDIMKRFFKPRSQLATQYTPSVPPPTVQRPTTIVTKPRTRRPPRSRPYRHPVKLRCRATPMSPSQETKMALEETPPFSDAPTTDTQLPSSHPEERDDSIDRLLSTPTITVTKPKTRPTVKPKTGPKPRPAPKLKIHGKHISRTTGPRHRHKRILQPPIDPNQTKLSRWGFLCKVQRSQADREAKKLDYSGSFVSTTP